VNDTEARGTSEARLNAIIQAAALRLQQLVKEYERRPDATVSGVAFMREEALDVLKKLVDMKNQILGDD
jgi:septum formation topological specificity factor MinE